MGIFLDYIRRGLIAVKWPIVFILVWFAFAVAYQLLKINGMPSYVGVHAVMDILFIVLVIASVKWD